MAAPLFGAAPLVTFQQEGGALDYTPGSDVPAGAVVVAGGRVGVVRADAPANRKGSVAVGPEAPVFLFPKTAGGGTAIADGVDVFWDATNSVVTTNPAGGTNKRAGSTAAAALDADTTVQVRLGASVGEAGAGGEVTGVATGYKLARGEATLDGANPTSIVTGLATVVAFVATRKSAATPGDDATVFTGDYGGAVAAGTVNLYGWKHTTGGAAGNPTLVASTSNTAVASWIAVGT